MIHLRTTRLLLPLLGLLPVPALGSAPVPGLLQEPGEAQEGEQEETVEEEDGSAFRNDLRFEDAKALAAKEGKALVLCFYHSDDSRSVGYSNRVWGGEMFQDWARRKVVAMRYDAQRRSALGLRMNIKYYPTLLILDPGDGGEVARLEGPVAEGGLVLACESLMLGRIGTPTRPEGDRAEDPMAWLAWANHLLSESRAEEAVAAYMWCYDNGEARLPGFLDRYGEFVLQRTRSMNLMTRAAKAALEERRYEMSARIRDGVASDVEARQIARLDYWLNQVEMTVALFDELEGATERRAELREIVFRQILERLVDEGRYADVLAMLGDPRAEFVGRLDAYEEEMARLLASEVEIDPIVLSAQREGRDAIEQDGILFYEVLLGTGRGEDAAAVAERLLGLQPNVRTYVQLIRAAHDVGLGPLAETLAQRGMAEHEEDPKAIRQIQRAASDQNRVGIKRLDPSEIERRRQERLRQREQDGDGGDGGDGDGGR